MTKPEYSLRLSTQLSLRTRALRLLFRIVKDVYTAWRLWFRFRYEIPKKVREQERARERERERDRESE